MLTGTVAGGALLAFLGTGGCAKGPGEAAATPLSVPECVARIVEFLGALFGHALTSDDRAELTDRLQFTLHAESRLETAYRVLARHLDDSARAAGATSFLEAGSAIRQQVIDALMRAEETSLLGRIWGHFSSTRRQYNRMQSQTVPRLAWLYRHSGVPWRARGYQRWPGLPGDWRDVTRAGPAYP